ncbi:MAG: hypothetical protein AVDCRST_MAG11-336, partial [uncultured Gemmatimonadaceae bacterium]
AARDPHPARPLPPRRRPAPRRAVGARDGVRVARARRPLLLRRAHPVHPRDGRAARRPARRARGAHGGVRRAGGGGRGARHAPARGPRARLGDDRRRGGARHGGLHGRLQAAPQPVLPAERGAAVRRARHGVHVRRAALPLPPRRGAVRAAVRLRGRDGGAGRGARAARLRVRQGAGGAAPPHGARLPGGAPRRDRAHVRAPRAAGLRLPGARRVVALPEGRGERPRDRPAARAHHHARHAEDGDGAEAPGQARRVPHGVGLPPGRVEHLQGLRPRAPALRPRRLRRAGAHGHRERGAQGVHDARPGELRALPARHRRGRRAHRGAPERRGGVRAGARGGDGRAADDARVV